MSNLAPARQSPFRRQPSTNTPRASTPTSSPTKPSLLSPARGGSLPPERSEVFTRQPAQNDLAGAASVNSIARPDHAFQRGGSLSPTKADSSVNSTGGPASKSELDSPVKRFQSNTVVSPSPSIISSLDGGDAFGSSSTQILHRPSSPATTIVNTVSASTRQPVFAKQAYHSQGNTAYNNIPAPLLRSFRESFEVLDPNATGSLNSSSLPPVLDQLGLANETTLSSFFPHNKSQNLSLAAYLDLLSAPFGELSSQEELAAAFSAFDVDDSGQIDVHDLREAVLRTMPEPGEVNVGARLSEAEVDGILSSFTGRRAFAARGLGAQKTNAKGEVFKWREFAGNLNGGIDDRTQTVAA